MNKPNMKTIGCALALSLAPFSANAVTESQALEACADALAGQISGTTGIETAYRLDQDLPGGDKLLYGQLQAGCRKRGKRPREFGFVCAAVAAKQRIGIDALLQ